MTIAIYPGSFDPVTNGHLDIINRAAGFFELLVIGVYDTPPKNLCFTTQERVDLMTQSIKNLSNVRVESYQGLTITFARKVKATALVRGLRMSSDFEREFEMSLMNKKVAPDIESVFLMASLEYQFLSSSLLKEVATLGGSEMVKTLVPPPVIKALKKKNLI